MPEMSGLTLITEAKAIQPLLSVLVLSAYDNFEYVRTALRNGAENYLLKPLNPEELLESIQSVAKHLKERNTLSNTYGSSMLTFRSLFTKKENGNRPRTVFRSARNCSISGAESVPLKIHTRQVGVSK